MIPPVGCAPDHETLTTWLLRRLVVSETFTENDRRSTTPFSKNVLHSASAAVNDAPLVEVTGRAPQPGVLATAAGAAKAVSATKGSAASAIRNRASATRRRGMVVFISLTPVA